MRLADLELSTRTANVLRDYDVITVERFKELTKKEVLAWKNAGIVTWREIRETQRNLHRIEWEKSSLGQALSHVRALNRAMMSELSDKGFFLRFDVKGRLRLGRYLIPEDFDDT